VNRFSFCSSTEKILIKNETYLSELRREAEEFHFYGGNLKSIENLMNEAIDATYLNSGAEFFPDGSTVALEKNQSIKNYIKNSKIIHDKNHRGGYGDRSNYGKFKNLPKFLSREEGIIDVIEPQHHFLRWKASLGPNFEKACRNITDISFRTPKLGLEEKTFCSLPPPGQLEESCEIISIGSNRQWGFEHSFLKLYPHCTIHTFDCTTKDNPEKPKDERIKFYPFCISNEEKEIDELLFLTFENLVEKTGIVGSPDILKLDVEGFEYDVFTNMLRTSKKLLPLQISVELHYATRMYDIEWERRWRNSGELALFSSMMFIGGYLPVKMIPQRGCDSCMEVLYARLFC
jgi:hypothetical protein